MNAQNHPAQSVPLSIPASGVAFPSALTLHFQCVGQLLA